MNDNQQCMISQMFLHSSYSEGMLDSGIDLVKKLTWSYKQYFLVQYLYWTKCPITFRRPL